MKKFRLLILMVVIALFLAAVVAVAQTTGDPPVQVDWLMVVLGALLALSEALAWIPGIASNSTFQLIVNIIRRMLGKSSVTTYAPDGTKFIGGPK